MNIWNILGIGITSIILFDLFRVLVLKLLMKRLRFFAFVSDNENLRRQAVALKYDVEPTDVIKYEDGQYGILNREGFNVIIEVEAKYNIIEGEEVENGTD